MKKLCITISLITLSILSLSQNESITQTKHNSIIDNINKTPVPLSCNVTLVGSTNPTAFGLCDGTMTLSLAACSNPPYSIQWSNPDLNPPCQQLPPDEIAFTGTIYTVNTLCGCGSPYSFLIRNAIGEEVAPGVVMVNPAPTGLDELFNENNIAINPNPANDLLTIALKSSDISNANIEITNTLGQIVLSSRIQGDKSSNFNIQQLPNGIYFVKVYASDKQIGFKKIVVQK